MVGVLMLGCSTSLKRPFKERGKGVVEIGWIVELSNSDSRSSESSESSESSLLNVHDSGRTNDSEKL